MAMTSPAYDDAEAAEEAGETASASPAPSAYADVASRFWPLGWTAFGGPTAHLGVFESVFVQRLRWFTSAHFAEMVAVASALPGPTSTQVSFAIGLVRGRGSLASGVLSGLLFQYPGLLMMSVAGYAYARFAPAGAARGERAMHAASVGGAAAGVALVFLAVRSLAKRVCAGRRQATIAVAVAVVGMMVQQRAGVTSYLYPGLIILSGLVELSCRRVAAGMARGSDPRDARAGAGGGPADAADAALRARLLAPAADRGGDAEAERPAGGELHGLGAAAGVLTFLVWAALLAVSIVGVELVEYTSAPALHWWSTFFKAGSLTFGGGHVVLPLLMDEITQKYSPLVANCTAPAPSGPREPAGGGPLPPTEPAPDCGWVTTEQFLFGLALVQALPGPLFNLSAFLGAVMAIRSRVSVCVGVAAAWLGLFTPGVLLIFSASAFWRRARDIAVYREMLPGMNAAAVGLIMTACYALFIQVLTMSAAPGLAASLGLIAASSIEIYGAPAPAVILTGAILSLLALACGAGVG